MYSESFKTHAKPITQKVLRLAQEVNALNDEYNPMMLQDLNGQRIYNIDKRLDELVQAVKHLRTVLSGTGSGGGGGPTSSFFY
jgi:hypothetical protein